MKSDWAEKNLQTIRTLMERSTLYRRALAPVMLLAGALGLITAVAGMVFHVDEPRAFAGLWFGTAGVAVAAALLLTRCQALRDQEPFWSPPTRRVGLALLPPLACGFLVGVLMAALNFNWQTDFAMSLLWALFYGCALHSAGFFVARGVKWFGWIFIVAAILLAVLQHFSGRPLRPPSAHVFMGLLFGLGHVIYGGYLYLTEKGKRAA